MLKNILNISNKHIIKIVMGGGQECYGGGNNIMAKSRNSLAPRQD